MNHNSISLAMIVKNEADNLPQCLDSVKNCVEEMIIVDTGSTDNTKEIALSYGAKVYDYQWNDNFAEARNYGLQYVSGDWILVLDADEVFNSKILPQIKPLIEKENSLVVNLIRQEIGAISSPYSSLSRLFRHHPDICFSRPYHALIDDSVINLQQKERTWKIFDLVEVAIQHYGYQPQIIAQQDKAQRARKAMESYFAQHPQDAYICSKLGAMYISLGEFKKGLKLLKTGLKSNLATPTVLFELHYHLANTYVKEQQISLAIKHYQKAIALPILGKLKLGAYHNYGSLCYQRGEYKQALNLYRQCITIEPHYALAYYNLGLTHRAMGNISLAMETYHQAIKLNPEYPWAYQNLGVLLLQQGYTQESVSIFQKAYILHKRQNPSIAESLKEELKLIGLNLVDENEEERSR